MLNEGQKFANAWFGKQVFADDAVIQRPTSLIPDPNNLEERIVNLTAQVIAPATPGSTTTAQPSGTPLQVNSLVATESPIKQIDRTFSQVAVSFTRDATDQAFQGVRIWVSGYRGNTNWVAVTDAQDSPVFFLLETTKENIVVKAQAFGVSAADFDAAPTTTVMLDGVLSAPPAPSAGSLLSTPFGFQFSFTQLPAQTADVIDSYRVYRSTTSSFGAAVLIQTIKHSPTNVGNVVVQDQIEQYQTRWYWITAVDTSGLESSTTLVGTGVSGAVAQGGPGYNLVYNGDFSILTDPSGTASSLESAARTSGAPNGWTMGWLNDNSSPDGLLYRANVGGMLSSGTWSLVLQDRFAGGGDIFSAVCDAFPVAENTVYWFSCRIFPNAGVPTHARWIYQIQWFKRNATDFSRSSADSISIIQMFGPSSVSTQGVYANAQQAPTNAGYCRISYYHWWDGVAAPTSQWNLCVADVRCVPLLTSQQQAAVANSYAFTATGILTQSGTTTTINVAASTAQFGFGQIGYNSGSVNPGSYGTWYIYADDPSYQGGAVSYQATSVAPNSVAADGRIYFGKITTAAGGGGTGGGGGCFNGATRVETPDGPQRFDQMPEFLYVRLEDGSTARARLIRHRYKGPMREMGEGELVTSNHLIRHDGKWVRAEEIFPNCVDIDGEIFTLTLLVPTPFDWDKRAFRLANGHAAHNLPPFKG